MEEPASFIFKTPKNYSSFDNSLLIEAQFLENIGRKTLSITIPKCYLSFIGTSVKKSFILMEDFYWGKAFELEDFIPENIIIKLIEQLAEF